MTTPDPRTQAVAEALLDSIGSGIKLNAAEPYKRLLTVILSSEDFNEMARYALRAADAQRADATAKATDGIMRNLGLVQGEDGYWSNDRAEVAERERDEVVRHHDEQMLRVKACEHIAIGDEGWEQLRNECPSTAAVATLRDEYDRLRAQVGNLTTERDRYKGHGELADATCVELEAKIADLEARGTVTEAAVKAALGAIDDWEGCSDDDLAEELLAALGRDVLIPSHAPSRDEALGKAVLERLKAMRSDEHIMRDNERRRGAPSLATLHGDRARMLTETISAISAVIAAAGKVGE